MPTYDYRCQVCGHQIEVFQSFSETPKRKCPRCGKQKLERMIGSGAGILFKGRGFYQTDYRSESYRQGESADKAGTQPVSDAKGESNKPDAASKPTAAEPSSSAKDSSDVQPKFERPSKKTKPD